jgi:glucosamine-phosphate N-acetyltransferase
MEYGSILSAPLTNEVKTTYLELLSHLTDAPDMPLHTFVENVHAICHMGTILVCRLEGRVIGTGTLVCEPKLIHGGRFVGHIEDVVVHPDYRGQHVASTLLRMLVDEATARNCYKVILDCSAENIAFYEKNGFVQKNVQMAKYETDALPWRFRW